MPVRCRGIRGATTVARNDAQSVLTATRELMESLIRENDVRQEDVASIIFSCTPDLTAAFPARAARELGWSDTALFGCQEIAVEGSLPLCIRILIHWNTDRPAPAIRHVYLRGAEVLRPDRVPTT